MSKEAFLLDNQLCFRLYLETNTVTPLLQRMEKEGIITRAKGKTDARLKYFPKKNWEGKPSDWLISRMVCLEERSCASASRITHLSGNSNKSGLQR